eukprot:4719137-Pleurochrysis_carterae.AAC.1
MKRLKRVKRTIREAAVRKARVSFFLRGTCSDLTRWTPSRQDTRPRRPRDGSRACCCRRYQSRHTWTSSCSRCQPCSRCAACYGC